MVYIDIQTLADRIPQASFSSASGKVETEQMDEEREAFKKIARLVKVRDRSVCEVRNRLQREGYSEGASRAAIDKALSVRFLDDARFADVLVRSRLRAGKGLPGIERELKSHGINPEEILVDYPEGYLEDAPCQEDAAFALLCRKPPRAKNAKQAAYAKLVRAGYSASVATEATKRWWQGRETS